MSRFTTYLKLTFGFVTLSDYLLILFSCLFLLRWSLSLQLGLTLNIAKTIWSVTKITHEESSIYMKDQPIERLQVPRQHQYRNQ